MRLIVCKFSHGTQVVRDEVSFKLELCTNWLCPTDVGNHERAVCHALSLAAALAEMFLAVLLVKESPVRWTVKGLGLARFLIAVEREQRGALAPLVLAGQGDLASRLGALLDNLTIHAGDVLAELSVGALKVFQDCFVAGFAYVVLRKLGVDLATFRGVEDRICERLARVVGTDGSVFREYICGLSLLACVIGRGEERLTQNAGSVVDD